MTLLKRGGKDYSECNYLSISGATLIGKSISESTIPVALETFLNEHAINKIYLHFDNDRAGKETSLKIQFHLDGKYEIIEVTQFDNYDGIGYTPFEIENGEEITINNTTNTKEVDLTAADGSTQWVLVSNGKKASVEGVSTTEANKVKVPGKSIVIAVPNLSLSTNSVLTFL